MKRARKILVGLMAMVMVLGMCMTAQAGSTATPIKSISAKNATVYTNGTEAEKTVAVTLNWDKKKFSVGPEVATLQATSANRGIARVAGFKFDNEEPGKTKVLLQLIPVSTGKVKITISDSQANAKKKTITVTVKEWAEDITFGSELVVADATTADANDYTMTIAGTKGTSVNLGAAITNGASNKAITYKATNASGVKVDTKGNVKVTSNTATGATVTVASKDGKVTKTIKVTTGAATVDKFDIVKDSNSKNAVLGGINSKSVLTMKGNKSSEAYTYQIAINGAKASDLNFVSSKTSVATVDANGKVTAKGNGTAKITVSPKLGNSGKNVKKTITVKVTTDVEYVKVAKTEIKINAKGSANIGAATNADASNKTVKYEISKVTDAAGKAVDVRNIKKYATVSTKGVVKAKQACTVEVRAYAAANNKIDNAVTVIAATPASKVTITAATGSEVQLTGKKQNAATVTRTSATTAQKLDLDAKVDDNATKKDITWSTSNANVATVDANGVVTAVGNGKANITATAADGSKKKASVVVTVKTNAYDVIVKKAQTVGADQVVYVNSNATVKSAKLLAATTNADASNKKVTYDPVNVSAEAGKDAQVKVKTTTGYEEVFVVRFADKVAEDATVVVDATDVTKKVGEKFAINASINTVSSNDIVVDKTAVTFKSSDTKVVAVNKKTGELTAKKEGTATITVSDASGKAASVDVKVTVGRNTATVEKAVEATINSTIKAENRDYTGVTTKFDAKKNAFTLAITNPTQDVTKLEDTGIIAALDAIINSDDTLSYDAISIGDADDMWVADIEGIKANVTYNGALVLEGANIDAAVGYILTETTNGAAELKDWNGKAYELSVALLDTREGKVFNHTLTYDVATTMSNALYDSKVVDVAVAEEIEKLNVEGFKIGYEAADNEVEVVVTDGAKAIADVDAAYRTAFADAMNAMFEDATNVTLHVRLSDGRKDTVSKNRTSDSADFIDELLSEYAADLAEKNITKLSDLGAVVMSADVTFQVGTQTYTATYDVDVVIGEEAYEAVADQNIADAIEANKDSLATYGAVSYADNAFKVDFVAASADKKISEIAGTGLTSILGAVIDGTSAKSATVIRNGKATTVDNAADLLVALSDGVDTIAALNGQSATIKVLYESANGSSKKTLVYTVEYAVAGVSAASEEAVKETTEVVEETTEAVEETTEVVEETTEVVEETTEVVEETTEVVEEATEVVEETTVA